MWYLNKCLSFSVFSKGNIYIKQKLSFEGWKVATTLKWFLKLLARKGDDSIFSSPEKSLKKNGCGQVKNTSWIAWKAIHIFRVQLYGWKIFLNNLYE